MSAIDDLFDYSNIEPSRDMREGRYYGILDGIVTDVESDSPALGRIKADIGQRMRDDSGATVLQTTDWLEPWWPGGMECLPNVGDPVWVTFVDGDPNRGVWAWHPTTKTNERPTEAAVLGSKHIGMFNFLVTQFNQLRADFNTLAGQTAGHTHTGVTVGMGTTGAAAITKSSTTATDAQKGKAADGSVVDNVSTSEIVLSGKVKLR